VPLLTFDSLDQIPEGLREFAKQPEGSEKFNVNVVAQARIDEFRDNNIAISKERDDLKAKIDPLAKIIGEDPSAFEQELAELRTTAQRVKDGELKEGRAVEEAVAKRTDEMRKQFDERLQAEAKEKAAWERRHKELESKYKQSVVAAYVKDACISENSGVDHSAIDEIIVKSHSIFKLDDAGKLLANDSEGNAIYGSDGTSQMSPKEWLVKLQAEKPFFFRPTTGGGAGSGLTTKVGATGHSLQDLKSMSAEQRLEAANKLTPKVVG
jgi:hypothetical protein